MGYLFHAPATVLDNENPNQEWIYLDDGSAPQTLIWDEAFTFAKEGEKDDG